MIMVGNLRQNAGEFVIFRKFLIIKMANTLRVAQNLGSGSKYSLIAVSDLDSQATRSCWHLFHFMPPPLPQK